MTNSFFNFEEAPDFASAIGGTYESVNTSYDRREELEKLNDAVREKNAKLPVDIIKKLAGLIPTAKKLSDKIAWDKYNKDSAKENPWPKGTLDREEYDKIQNFLDQEEKLNSELLGEAYKKEDIPSIKALKADGIGQRSSKNIQFNADKVTWDSDFQQYIFNNNRTLKFDKLGDEVDFVNAFIQQKKENLIAVGFNNRYIEFFGRKKFDEIKANFLTKVKEGILKNEWADDQAKDIKNIDNLSQGENFNEGIYKWADLHKGKFNNNIAEALRYKIELMTSLNRADQLPYSVTENFLYSITEGKGDIAKMVIEKLGGSTLANVQVNKWLEAVEQSKSKALEAINTRDSNYKGTYYNQLRKDLYSDNNIPTKEELIDYIYKNEETRFDWSTGGLPEKVKGLLSTEAQNDAELIPMYEKKAKLGILTVAEVMKLESSDLRNKYLPQAISVNNMGMSKQIITMSKESIKTMADEVELDSIGKKDKSQRWLNIKQQAELLYPSLYAEILKTAAPNLEKGLSVEAVAHAETMKQLKDKAVAGHFDTWGEFTTNTLKMQSAVQYLAMDKDHINTQIIPGFEADVKAAMNLPPNSKTVLPAFIQLGKKIGVPGWQIQLQQKKVGEKLGGVEHVKSEVELAFEKLNDEQKKLLSKYPTPAKLARAKFLAFMEDSGEGEGVISWSELSVSHPDVAKFIFKAETGKDMPVTPTLGKLEPRKGDWKELPGATRIGYAVWDGKEWKYSSLRGRKNQEWIGGIDNFRDIDGYYKPFEGTTSDLTTTFFGGDEGINTAEEGGPRLGDWYKVTNKTLGGMKHIGDLTGSESKPFVVWNGKEWVYSAVKGKFRQEYQGPQPLSTIDEENAQKEKEIQERLLKRQENY